MSTALKFMSFNLRVDNDGDGINAFSLRFHRVLEVLEKEDPDVIGFQEVTESMRDKLRAELKGYTLQGCGRNKKLHGESMLIAYKTDAFELMSLDNVWLSATPRVPGTTYGGDQSPYPRMMTIARLKHNDIATPFRFINTHFDHRGKEARYLAAMQIIQLVSQYSEPFIITGDLNAGPTSAAVELLTTALADRGMVDCTAELGGTFHKFGALENEKQKIDYIFTDGNCIESHLVEDIPVNGQYYSDHHAIVASICVEA